MSDNEQGDECIGLRRTIHLVRSDPEPSFFFGLSVSLLAFRFNPCLLLPNACFLPLLGMPSMVIHHVQRRMDPSAQSVTFLLVDCTAIILVVPMIFSAADSTLQMPTLFSRSVPTELHGAPSAPRREAPQQNKRTHCCSSAAFVVLARPQVVEMALSATPLAAESPGGRTSSTVDATSARNSRARRTNSQMLGPPSVLIVTCWHSKPSVHVARDGCNNNHANTTISRNQQWSRQTLLFVWSYKLSPLASTDNQPCRGNFPRPQLHSKQSPFLHWILGFSYSTSLCLLSSKKLAEINGLRTPSTTSLNGGPPCPPCDKTVTHTLNETRSLHSRHDSHRIAGESLWS